MTKKFNDIEEWKDAVKKAYPSHAGKMRFHGRVENGKSIVSAEVPGLDRSFGVWDHDDEEGQVLGESRRVRESMTTFREFLTEAEVIQKATGIAKNLLGTLDISQVPNIPEDDLMRAKEVGHKFIDTAIGPWVVSAFKHAGKIFARVQPPKGSSSKTTYFVPKGQ